MKITPDAAITHDDDASRIRRDCYYRPKHLPLAWRTRWPAGFFGGGDDHAGFPRV